MSRMISLPMLVAATFCAVFALPQVARAQSHEYINEMRSSSASYFFMQQSVNAEYGRHASAAPATTEGGTPSATAPGGGSGGSNSGSSSGTSGSGSGPTASGQYWKGYGIGTTLGLEISKFFQVVAGHTFVNEKIADGSLETLTGSRLNAGGRLVFTAPIANLEAGAGILGSSVNYQKQLDTGTFYGSGVYYSLGMNYFTSFHVSFYGEIQMENEHLVKSSGSTSVTGIDTNMTTMGLGCRIWL